MGVPVTGLLGPTDPIDTYAVTDPLTGIDSWRSVIDVTARDAIGAQRRRQGMIVVVQTDSGLGPNLAYQLTAASPWAFDSTDWTLFSPGGSNFQGTQLISGGGVAWVSGYTFQVSAATYDIAGVFTTSLEQNVTLTMADATFDRYDLIVVDSSGVVSAIEGIAAASPIVPQADPATQLELTIIFVGALTTQPANITSTLLYDEDVGPATEWTASTTAGTFVLNSTNFPYHLTHDIEGTAVAANTYVQLAHSTPIDPTAFTQLVLHIRSKANWVNKSLSIGWYSTGVLQGAVVAVHNGVLGFSSTITAAYQQIVIPIGLFALAAGASVNQLRMQVLGGGANIGMYIDYIQLQTNSNALPSGYPAMIGGLTLLGNPTLISAIPSAITIGSGLLITGTTLSATSGSGTVTSVIAGTGLSGGTITTTGTIAIAAGGVGTTQLAAAGVTYAKIQNVAAVSLLGNPTGSPASASEITLGTGLSFSGTTLVGHAGTVTSVAMTVPSIMAIGGSPVTTAGTLAITLQTETANLVFAGPTTGSAATPTFRALVTADFGTNTVAYSNIQQLATHTLLGNSTGGTANVQEITLGAGLSFSGTTLVASGSGSVTTVSVVTANGFGGTVATATTTPAITITTGVSGLLKGNGTGVVAATAGVDYLTTNATITCGADTSGSGNTLLNITVIGINGHGLGSTVPTSGNLLIGSGTAWETETMSGDGTITLLGALTVTKTSGVSFAASATTDTTVATNITTGTLGAARLPTTGLTITQHAGVIGTGSIVSTTCTFDLSTHDWYTLTLSHSATTTLALSNATTGQQFTLILLQDGTGSCLVTWFSGIQWPGGIVPTLTLTAGKADIFTFKCFGTNTYYGFTPGLNM